jgi:spermidine synthase
MVSLSSAAFQHLPSLFLKLYWTWDLKQHFDKVFLVQFLLCAAVIFVPALIMGGLFPAAARVVVRDPNQTGERVAGLYAWNTAGSIVGSFAAGFILIPLLGIRGTLMAAVAAQCLGAVASTVGGNTRHTPKLAGIALGVLLLTVLLSPPWHQQLMTSAMSYYANSYGAMGTKELKAKLARREKLLYYRDGLSATVTVTRDLRSRNRDLYIATNGKVDGSSHYDMPNQRLLAHMPLLFHPDPRDVSIIGMGTGVTAGSASLYPVRQVTVVEIESAMVEGAKFFRKHNHAVHDNPKVDIRITDGRLFLRLHPNAFDVVISEPSNPWLAGVSDLFTVEFFTLGAKALRDGGIFAQWVQIYEMTPENVKTIVRTFTHVFPHVYLVSTIPNTDIVLLGSQRPFFLDLERAYRRMTQERFAMTWRIKGWESKTSTTSPPEFGWDRTRCDASLAPGRFTPMTSPLLRTMLRKISTGIRERRTCISSPATPGGSVPIFKGPPPRPKREGISSSAWRPRTARFSPEEWRPRCAICLVP